MNESNPNRESSPSVEMRKEAMLVALQGELASFHRRRKTKRIIAGSVAVGLSVLVFTLASLDFDAGNNVTRPNDVADLARVQTNPEPKKPESTRCSNSTELCVHNGGEQQSKRR